ncbi:MAG TPA: beta-N-acetylglucosaminidase domain-containing protein [Candidatus Brocadiia bacterium]|nr:beta-N-acetylglucosaminidase domain-containing protein [Candidatus Brocadiia bacterium]
MKTTFAALTLALASAWAVAADDVAKRLANDPWTAPIYTGAIYPAPRKAAYQDRFISLANTGLLLGPELNTGDPRVALLRERIERYGGKVGVAKSSSDDFGAFVLVGASPEAAPLLAGRKAPDKPQGYLIAQARSNGKPVILLAGRDSQGLAWAVMSLMQLITVRDGAAAAQAAEVEDWPAALARGAIPNTLGVDASALGGGALYPRAKILAQFKLNFLIFQSGVIGYRGAKWRQPLSAETREDLRRTGELLNPLGIRWSVDLRLVGDNATVRCGSDEDFAIVWAFAEAVAGAGADVGVHFDDHRFPLRDEDQKRFGSAREADIFFINRLHKALNEKYPGRRIVFCPPFYWGPAGSCAYSESREEYLSALGLRVPADVSVFWTGPRVKSGKTTQEDVAWITKLIRRKPLFWLNAFPTPHPYGRFYGADPIDWAAYAYDAKLVTSDVEAWTWNSQALIPTLTTSDYQWNPDGYDAKRSVEQAAKMFAGPETWPALQEFNQRMAWFTQFGLRVSPLAAKSLPEIEQRLKAAQEALARVEARYPAAVKAWLGLDARLNEHRNFAGRVKKNPNLARADKDEEETRALAVKEAGLAKTDTLLTAHDFAGGGNPRKYGVRCEPRVATWVYGARSSVPAMRAEFEIDPFPPEAGYKLFICGQDDEAPAACRIRIRVNDTVIFEGPNTFETGKWLLREFDIPAKALLRKNKLSIESMEDTAHYGGPPFFMLNYAIVRPGKG